MRLVASAMRWFWIGLSIVIVIIVVSVLFGSGGRGCFSPDTLEMRTQSEVLIPLVNLPIYRSSFSYSRYEIIELLIEKKLWTILETDNPRWEYGFHWNDQWDDGNGLYDRWLGWRSDEWIEWTESYPEVAAVFWPYVLQSMRGGDGWEDMTYVLLSNRKRFETIERFHDFLKQDYIASILEGLDGKR